MTRADVLCLVWLAEYFDGAITSREFTALCQWVRGELDLKGAALLTDEIETVF